MVINKKIEFCEPCEPTCESFFKNGSHIKVLILNVNNIFVNDVNHFYVRVRVEQISFINITHHIYHKNKKTSCARNHKKTFTSFTFLKNTFNVLKNKMNFYECFSLNHSQLNNIVHIF